jgi:hypothetical protein
MIQLGMGQMAIARLFAIQGAGAAAIALVAVISGMVPLRAADESDQRTAGNKTTPELAALYEEDPSNKQGKRFAGSAVWRTETVPPGPGVPSDLAVRVDIRIPERGMVVAMSLRRNSDPSLPASHTITITFDVPPDFSDGGIADVVGMLMKESEQARGIPLGRRVAKVRNGVFLVGLADADRQRNLQMLQDLGWFDMPIYYSDGRRAVLALQKGPSGVRALNDAFAAWGQ